MQVQPYLNFDGCCEQAIEFYRRALGAEVVMLMRFKDAPDTSMCPPGSGDRIMHANLRIGQTNLLASDSHCTGDANFKGFALSLTVANVAEAERAFAALSEGGKVEMPLSQTFFATRFGMVGDRFGVCWMIYLPA